MTNALKTWTKEELEQEKRILIENIIDDSAKLKLVIEEIGEF
jgi:hypothetical protein